jgi:hypothetical protein
VIHRLLADLLVVLHLGFILFVVLGGLLVLRWPRLAWVHLPCALWGLLIEIYGWICPLTPLENRWRLRGGQGGYEESFIEHYLLPVIYPPGLTRGVQLALAAAVATVNLAVYLLVLRRRRRRGARPQPENDGNFQ